MARRQRLDAVGLLGLLVAALLFGINQVLVKLVDVGLQPVFFAALRSIGATLCLFLWMAARHRLPPMRRDMVLAGLLVGCVFAAEFLCLFIALDLTTVVRGTIVFYSMPLWLTLAAHFGLPGERVTATRGLGLALAFAGVAWALVHRGAGAPGTASLAGDLLALLAAFGWAGTAFLSRATALSGLRPEGQIFWMVAVSGPVLLVASLFFGPLVRDLHPIHLWGLAFQIVAVVTLGYILWFKLLAVYPVSTVSGFSFLSPLASIGFGWLLLGEPVGGHILTAAALVAVGIVLISRPPRRVAN